jgi:hypothetical protein
MMKKKLCSFNGSWHYDSRTDCLLHTNQRNKPWCSFRETESCSTLKNRRGGDDGTSRLLTIPGLQTDAGLLVRKADEAGRNRSLGFPDRPGKEVN